MLRLVSWVVFAGFGLVAGRYYGLGSFWQLLAAVIVACALMRLLSGRRFI